SSRSHGWFADPAFHAFQCSSPARAGVPGGKLETVWVSSAGHALRHAPARIVFTSRLLPAGANREQSLSCLLGNIPDSDLSRVLRAEFTRAGRPSGRGVDFLGT